MSLFLGVRNLQRICSPLHLHTTVEAANFPTAIKMTVSLLQKILLEIFKEKAVEVKALEIVVDNAAIPSSQEFIAAMNASLSHCAFSVSPKYPLGDLDDGHDELDCETPFTVMKSHGNEAADNESWRSSRWASESGPSNSSSPLCPVRSPTSTSLKSSFAKNQSRRRSLPRNLRPLRMNGAPLTPAKPPEGLNQLLEKVMLISSLSPPPPPPSSSPGNIMKGNKKSPLTSPGFRKTCKKANLVF